MTATLKTTIIQEPSSASSNIQLDANGNTYLVPVTGNVGIGTTSPGKKLDVFNSGTTTTDLVVRNGTVSLLSFVDSGAGYLGTSTNHPLLITTNNTERMRIDSSGNVGIGRTPVLPLDISATTGNIRLTSSTGTNYAQLQTVNGSGTARFGVEGSGGGNIAGGSSAYSAVVSQAGAYSLHLGTNNTVQATIDSSGNVGIGTTSLTSKFTVAGAASLYTSTNSNAGSGYVLAVTGTGAKASTTDNTNFAIFSNDALASNPLLLAISVVGNATTASRYAYLQAGEYGTGTSSTLALNPSGGNVGIGTTSPNASAILDAQSTTKGVRFPNMTTTQKNAISSPAAGLVVFDTTLAKLCVYSGSAWQTITSV